MQQPDVIVCSAGCKRTASNEKDASEKGWEVLPISTRWRCPHCTQELEHANEIFRESVRSMV